jgi:hypothetical protein
VSAPFDALAPEARKRLRRAALPRWIAPMLATLVDDPFSDEDKRPRDVVLERPAR